MVKKFIFILLLIQSNNLFSQMIFETDTISSSKDSISINSYFKNKDHIDLDTTYFRLNSLVTSYSCPTVELLPSNYYLTHLQKLKFQKDNSFFQTKIPRTYVFYGVKSAKQQIFNIHHIQNIKRINLSVEYLKNKGDGFYLNQGYNKDFAEAQISYSSIKNNYFIVMDYQFNQMKQNENGGIQNDSLFENNIFSNSQTLNVNLNQAKNEFTSHTGYLKQIIKPLKLKNKLQFNHEIKYIYSDRIYQDIPDTLFFDNIFIDSNTTNDYYITEKIGNSIGIQFFKFVIGEIKFNSEFINYKQNTFDTSSLLNSLELNLSKKINQLNIQVNSNYIFTGFNSNNYEIKSSLNYDLNSTIKRFFINIEYLYQSPEIRFLKLNSNHYYWNNQFENSTYFNFNFGIKTKSIGGLTYNFSSISNLIYIGENKSPQQQNDLISLHTFNYNFSKEFKKVQLKTFLTYQIDDDIIYRLPEIVAFTDINIKGKLKALELRFGIKAWYYSSFYSNAYDPSINEFYLQNEKKTGNYPYFDFYIRSSIKTVEMKFAIEHFNSGLMKQPYYSTLHYPSAPRTFAFSLSWKFTD